METNFVFIIAITTDTYNKYGSIYIYIALLETGQQAEISEVVVREILD